MTFKDLQVGDIFRDVPSEFGETFMLVMDREYRKFAIGYSDCRGLEVQKTFNPDDEVEITE
jgi:hypothetical protein